MSQHRYQLEALVTAAGTSEHRLGARVGLSGTTLKRAREHGLTADAADRYAIRAGLHPYEVWPDMKVHDLELAEAAEQHKAERRRAAWREAKRKRWATDPEYREQRRAYMRRYRAEARDAIAAQKRRWIEANRDRVRQQTRESTRRWRERQRTGT